VFGFSEEEQYSNECSNTPCTCYAYVITKLLRKCLPVSTNVIQCSVTVYRDYEGLGFQNITPKSSLIFTLWHLVRHSQAQINHKPSHVYSWYKILKFFCLTEFSTDWLIYSLTYAFSMCDSIMAIATGLISSLFNIASSRNVPFCQPTWERNGAQKENKGRTHCKHWSCCSWWGFAVHALWRDLE